MRGGERAKGKRENRLSSGMDDGDDEEEGSLGEVSREAVGKVWLSMRRGSISAEAPT